MGLKQAILRTIVLLISSSSYAVGSANKMIQVDDPTFSGLLKRFSCKTEYQTFCNSHKACRALFERTDMTLKVDLIKKTVSVGYRGKSQDIKKEVAHTWLNSSSERVIDVYTTTNNHVNLHVSGKPNSKWITDFSYSEPATNATDTNAVYFGKCVIGK